MNVKSKTGTVVGIGIAWVIDRTGTQANDTFIIFIIFLRIPAYFNTILSFELPFWGSRALIPGCRISSAFSIRIRDIPSLRFPQHATLRLPRNARAYRIVCGATNLTFDMWESSELVSAGGTVLGNCDGSKAFSAMLNCHFMFLSYRWNLGEENWFQGRSDRCIYKCFYCLFITVAYTLDDELSE